MKRVLVFGYLSLMFFFLGAVEKDRLAVMDVQDEDRIFSARSVVKVTDYIFAKFQETNSFWMVPMTDRDNALEQAIENTVKGSRKECVDEKCQLSLVAQLQANYLINTKIKKLYEGTCNITVSKFDVEKRAGVQSWGEKFDCTEKGLYGAIDSLNFGVISGSSRSAIPSDYDGLVEYLDELLDSSKSNADKISAINNLFSNEYFKTNGIRLIIKKLDAFPILSEKLFSATMAECKQGKIHYCYFTGRYFDELKKYKEAVELYKKACDGEYMKSCSNLGMMYLQGDGVAQDKDKALSLFKVACDGGNMSGCGMLGLMYANGNGVALDRKRAMELYKKACDSGDPGGCMSLGIMFFKGDGVEQDKKKAIELVKNACDGGVMLGCGLLGAAYADGNGVAQDYKKAVEFYKRACDGGEMRGCGSLGVSYFRGDGVEQDKKKAM